MQNMQCNLCGSKNLFQREGKVRDNDTLKIFECKDCGLVFLSSFDHIKEDFYENAQMHDGEKDLDIEVWLKETEQDDVRRFEMFKSEIKNKTIIDFGCGCGGFLKLAKNNCKQAYGVELEKRLQPYFKSQQLNVVSDISELNVKVDYIFLFHVFEHIEKPNVILETFKNFLLPGGKLIIEVPNSDDALLTLYKNKAFSEFTYWSPHLFLYNEKTLTERLAQSEYKLKNMNQYQRYGLANHLYWLANGKPGGQNIWNFMENDEINALYYSILAKQKKCDTIIGEFVL